MHLCAMSYVLYVLHESHYSVHKSLSLIINQNKVSRNIITGTGGRSTTQQSREASPRTEAGPGTGDPHLARNVWVEGPLQRVHISVRGSVGHSVANPTRSWRRQGTRRAGVTKSRQGWGSERGLDAIA